MREIARLSGVARSTVRDMLVRFERSGLSWPVPAEISDEDLEARLYGSAGVKPGRRKQAEPDWSVVARELKRKHVTLQVLWEEVHPHFTAVARDPVAAMNELAPFFHHVNNSYGEWNHEEKAPDDPLISPMSLDEFVASGTLDIVTPGQAIDKFRGLQAKFPLEHVMLAVPAGMRPGEFKEYAGLFAEEVIPAFQEGAKEEA